MSQVGNWTIESCTTVGTGDLILGGAQPGFALFRDSIPAGQVWYSVQDGANREAGIGTFNGVDTITRNEIHATYSNGVYNDVNPIPIDLDGDSIVACTFNSKAYRDILAHISDTDNPHGVVASQISYDPTDDPTSIETNIQDALVDHGTSIEERVPSMSGVIEGGIISGAGTQFDVTAGSGIVYDNRTDPSNTSVTPVTWLAQNNVTIQTGGLSAGPIRIFITAAGNVLQVSGVPSLALWRDNIFLGAVFVVDGQIVDWINAPAIIKQTATDAYDLMVGDIKLTGSAIEPVDNQLQIWVREGSLFYPGVNWYNDRAVPNTSVVPQQGDSTTPVLFHTMTQTGLIGAKIDTIPDDYNPTGDTLSNLPGNDATIHRLYATGVTSNRTFILLYGQQQYADAQAAKDNLRTDEDLTVFPTETASMTFLGWICVEGNAPDFNDINDAWIVSAEGSQGSGSTSPTTDHTILVNRNALNQHPIESIGTTSGEQLRDTLDAKARWRGPYTPQTYVENDWVIDGAYGAICVTSAGCDERPAPVPYGDPFFVYDGTISENSISAKQVIFGSRYTFATDAILAGYRVYTKVGNVYSVFSVQDPTGAKIITQLKIFTATVDGWTEFNIAQSIILEGVAFDLVVGVQEPDPTPTTFQGDWNYTNPNNTAVPASGTIVHSNKESEEFRIHATDNGATNRYAELAALTVGDIITDGTTRWAIQAITDNTTWLNFIVAPAVQSPPSGVKTFTFETVTATPITYAIDTDYNLGSATVRGLYGADTDYDSIVPDDNQYGVDINVQGVTLSDQWDIVSISTGTGAGANGGGDTGTIETLPAIDKQVNSSTVNYVFIYDTSTDDDCGDWTETAVTQSWYNEALNTSFRGKTRAFPKLAIITVENSRVTIYDGNDPDLPMWMVFTYSGGAGNNKVVCKNGILYSVNSANSPNREYDFINDRIFSRYSFSSANGFIGLNIAQRNSGGNGSGDSNTIIDWTCNDIAVASDGNMNNIQYVATDSGVTRIGTDGVASNWTDTQASTNVAKAITIADDYVRFFTNTNASSIYGWQYPVNDELASDVFNDRAIDTSTGQNWSPTKLVITDNVSASIVRQMSANVMATSRMVIEIDPSYGNWGNSMALVRNTSYISGWMQGDIKGAFLANNDADDRSYQNNALVLTGTLTEAPAATGAELQVYSGFSGANYLEGTNGLYVDTLYSYGWVNTVNGWEFKHGVVSAGEIDGLSITGNTLRIEGTLPKALIRIGSQPTAAQLQKIEEDERPLFNENARCLAQGTSNSFNAVDQSSDGIATVCSNNHVTRFKGLLTVSDEGITVTSVSRACNNKEMTGA